MFFTLFYVSTVFSCSFWANRNSLSQAQDLLSRNSSESLLDLIRKAGQVATDDIEEAVIFCKRLRSLSGDVDNFLGDYGVLTTPGRVDKRELVHDLVAMNEKLLEKVKKRHLEIAWGLKSLNENPQQSLIRDRKDNLIEPTSLQR